MRLCGLYRIPSQNPLIYPDTQKEGTTDFIMEHRGLNYTTILKFPAFILSWFTYGIRLRILCFLHLLILYKIPAFLVPLPASLRMPTKTLIWCIALRLKKNFFSCGIIKHQNVLEPLLHICVNFSQRRWHTCWHGLWNKLLPAFSELIIGTVWVL